MSSPFEQPDWLWDVLNTQPLLEATTNLTNGVSLTVVDGIPRTDSCMSDAQEQTRDAFGFKWEKRDTFEGNVTDHMSQWLEAKYGSASRWLHDLSPNPVVLDAGCGASMSGLAYFGSVLGHIRYLGVDVSTAVDVAARRFAERGAAAGFIQADLLTLPLPSSSVDLIFSEGVLHHTDNTKDALTAITRLLKPGGRVLFYVYRKKGPIREFTDDYIREKMQSMSASDGWHAMEPLTKLGHLLGELNVDIDIPEPIDILDIPAGKINLQRFFYWHVCKAFYRPEMSLDEMTHINFDWFAPRNAHRQTESEVRSWCTELGLTIEHEYIEEAGITIVAQRPHIQSN